MRLSLKKIFRTSSFCKVSSFIIGYLFWFILAQDKITSLQTSVPLCFYNTHDTIIEKAPEEIYIVLQAKRSIFATLDMDQLSAHVDAQLLYQGSQVLKLSHEHLLLPSNVQLQGIKPSNITVIAKKNE